MKILKVHQLEHASGLPLPAYHSSGAAGLDPDYLEQVIRAYLDTGNHAEGPVRAARSYVFEMADLVPFAVRYFEATYGRAGS